MSPRRVSPLAELRLCTLNPGESLEGFRAVGVSEPDDPDLASYFRSHYEEGMEPRYEQVQHAAMHMAVSMWRERVVVVRLRLQLPRSRPRSGIPSI